VDYSVKTLSQLRPVLRGFRKAAGLTQAMLAARLGITQQSYAQFEANPATAGVERLFKVLRLLNASITLSQDKPSAAGAAPVAKIASSSRASTTSQGTAKAAPHQGTAKSVAKAPAKTTAKTTAKATAKGTAKSTAKRATPAVKTSERLQAGAATPGGRKAAGKTAPRAKSGPARTERAAVPPRKREPW
jgi:HTH-type transcriptional regulator/antitoxin HipB